jgi:RES domain-containing protein
MGSRPESVFRIADRRHEIFDGTGAFLNGARWNSPGRRIIYTADTFAGAMLEILVHTRIGKVPRTHAWIEVELPADVPLEQLDPEGLPGWEEEDSLPSRTFGNLWHESQRSLVLVVPSAVTSGIGRNVLINQDHPDFRRLRASAERPLAWDARLFQG